MSDLNVVYPALRVWQDKLAGAPIPSVIPWTMIATTGAATVLSFGILTEYFPSKLSGRANAARFG